MNTPTPSTATPNGTRAGHASPPLRLGTLLLALLLAALGAAPAAA